MKPEFKSKSSIQTIDTNVTFLPFYDVYSTLDPEQNVLPTAGHIDMEFNSDVLGPQAMVTCWSLAPP